ncbi:MAG: MFS transporter [Alteromonadaceae bacterium]|nr:MFS transporter [Alteromonadaceae bacterium]
MIDALRRAPLLVIAASASFSMSTLFSSVKPVLLTQFVAETGVTRSMAGWFVAMPFIGIALATFVVAALLARFSYTRLVNAAGAILVASQLLLSVTFEVPFLTLLLQLVSGAAVGILMGVTSYHIARTPSPGVLFGIVDTIGVLLMSVMVAGVGIAATLLGVAGGFLFSAALCTLFWLLMYVYAGEQVVSRCQNDAQRDSPMLRPVIIIVMGVLFVTFSGQGFAFMFSIANQLGMSMERAGAQIGIVLFVSAFACLAGGVACARFGPERPLLCAFIICAVSWTVAIHAQSPTVFLAALLPAISMLQFSFPILLAFAGTLDTDGKWAAVATPLFTSGFAWAAVLAGVIVESRDIATLAFSTQAGMFLCALLLGASVLTRPTEDLVASAGDADEPLKE